MSQTQGEDALGVLEAELADAEARGDAPGVATARTKWVDAAELRIEDLERAGRPVPDALRARLDRYREDIAAG